MSETARRQADPSVVAVLHQAGGRWRGLIARVNGRTEADGRPSRPRILATRETDAVGDFPLDDWLAEHAVERVICVLPAASVVCRTCTLPDASREQLQMAIGLQAEAHLPDIAPPHRLGLAVLDAAPGETTRCGLMLAWPESAAVPEPPTDRQMTFAPDVAALAALLDGQRPAEPLIWIGRSDGSVALAITHAGGTVFRSTREDPGQDGAWPANIGRVIAETALGIGHGGTFVDTLVATTRAKVADLPSDGLLMPVELIQAASVRIDGVSADPGWWSTYGVAVGALLASTDNLAALTRLKDSLPVKAPSLASRLHAGLSRPRNLGNALVACVLIIALSPLLLSGLRLWVLKARLPELDARLAAVNQADDRLGMYRELGANAWSMTKILSDIASNTPEGIELQSIRVTQGESIAVSGRATPHDGREATEIVSLMQKQLQDSDIFGGVVLNWGDRDRYGNYQFDLSAKVVQPHLRPDYPEELDFGLWTLADRRDGKGPGTSDEPRETEEGSGDRGDQPEPQDPLMAPGETESEPPPFALAATDRDPAEPAEDAGELPAVRFQRTRSGRPDAPEGASRATDRSSEGSKLPPSKDIPPPRTAEEIDAMSLPEAQEALAKVARARKHAKGNDELEQRLKEEFRLLFERVRRGS